MNELLRTLDLIKLYDSDGNPVFFVVRGWANPTREPYPYDDGPLDRSYHYDDHSCPMNYIGNPVIAVVQKDEPDPHGVFDYVRSIWEPDDWAGDMMEEYAVMALFPEINGDAP